jgi:hypothetical protein
MRRARVSLVAAAPAAATASACLPTAAPTPPAAPAATVGSPLAAPHLTELHGRLEVAQRALLGQHLFQPLPSLLPLSLHQVQLSALACALRRLFLAMHVLRRREVPVFRATVRGICGELFSVLTAAL